MKYLSNFKNFYLKENIETSSIEELEQEFIKLGEKLDFTAEQIEESPELYNRREELDSLILKNYNEKIQPYINNGDFKMAAEILRQMPQSPNRFDRFHKLRREHEAYLKEKKAKTKAVQENP